MDDRLRLKAAQLGRMRGMTRYYHDRFFSDVRFTAACLRACSVCPGLWEVEEALLLVPVVALLGATMTAFDASYLLFARHYPARLEADLNVAVGEGALLAAQVEDIYLFPLNKRKVVVAALDRGFTWFGFMTLFITAMGVVAFLVGLALGLPVLGNHGSGWVVAYLAGLGILTVAALAVGLCWFVGGEGERRLRSVLETRQGSPAIDRIHIRLVALRASEFDAVVREPVRMAIEPTAYTWLRSISSLGCGLRYDCRVR